MKNDENVTEVDWKNHKTYIEYVIKNEYSRDFDDYGNKFKLDKEGRIIYRIDSDDEEYYYMYYDNIIYIYNEYKCEDFYKWDIKNNICIKSICNGDKIFINKDLDKLKYIFTIHMNGEYRYMNVDGINLKGL